MPELDALSRNIDELKNWQNVAWRRVADPSVTPFERREIRNHIKQSDEVLRSYLGIMSERVRFKARAVEDAGDVFAKLGFRLLGVKQSVEAGPAAAASQRV